MPSILGRHFDAGYASTISFLPTRFTRYGLLPSIVHFLDNLRRTAPPDLNLQTLKKHSSDSSSHYPGRGLYTRSQQQKRQGRLSAQGPLISSDAYAGQFSSSEAVFVSTTTSSSSNDLMWTKGKGEEQNETPSPKRKRTRLESEQKNPAGQLIRGIPELAWSYSSSSASAPPTPNVISMKREADRVQQQHQHQLQIQQQPQQLQNLRMALSSSTSFPEGLVSLFSLPQTVLNIPVSNFLLQVAIGLHIPPEQQRETVMSWKEELGMMCSTVGLLRYPHPSHVLPALHVLRDVHPSRPSSFAIFALQVRAPFPCLSRHLPPSRLLPNQSLAFFLIFSLHFAGFSTFLLFFRDLIVSRYWEKRAFSSNDRDNDMIKAHIESFLTQRK